MKHLIFLISVFCISSVAVFAQNHDPLPADRKLSIFTFEIKEEIAPPAVLSTRKALAEADSMHADLIILYLDTYGGAVDAADEIRTLLLDCKIPVWAFIENNAASAGAFIAIACDSIYMKPGSTIGATTVVNQSGEKVGVKYQDFMRSRMRSTAERNGRDPDIAEGMVEVTRPIPGIADSGRVISLTVKEALEVDYCDGEYASLDELLKGEGITDYQVTTFRPGITNTVIRFFLSPAVSGILITVIILGIFWELKTPGIGIPTVVVIVAAALYFVPLYFEGLAANWEIIAFIVGLILLLLEIFVIPGFGVAGVLGGTLVFLSLVFGLVGTVQDSDFIFPVPHLDGLLRAVLVVLCSVVASTVVIFLFARHLLHSRTFRRVEVATVQSRHDGYVALPVLSDDLIGQKGITRTTLRPSGNIEVNGEIYEAIAENGYMEKGVTVKVTGRRDFVLTVIEA